MLSPAAYGGTAMLRGLAGVPLLTPVIAPDSRIQVVSVRRCRRDRRICAAGGCAGEGALGPRASAGRIRSRDIVVAIRQWLGWPPRPLVALPRVVQRLMTLSPTRSAGSAGAVRRARPRSPSLPPASTGDPTSWIAATGIRPQSLEDILAAHPAGVQERWFARLYLLKPIAIAVLALFWFATGAIALGPGRARRWRTCMRPASRRRSIEIILIGGAMFDIVLGLLLLVRRATRAVLITMLAVTPFYVLAGTLLAPGLWADPLGPLTKIGPLLVATLVRPRDPRRTMTLLCSVMLVRGVRSIRNPRRLVESMPARAVGAPG